MAYSEKAIERRTCKAETRTGLPCRAWALWDCPVQMCAAHFYTKRGPELTPEERQAHRRRRAVCRCVAYQWPHRPGYGACRWPDDPIEHHPTPAGTHRAGYIPRYRIEAIKTRLKI